VLVGNGDGTFQPAVTSTVSVSMQSLLAGDLNGDSKADLVIRTFDNLAVLLSKRDGTFLEPQPVTLPNQISPVFRGAPLPPTALSVSVCDFNSDNTLDLVIGGQTSFTDSWGYYYYDSYVNVLLGNGDGTFAAKSATHVDYSPYTLVVDKFTN